MFSMDSLSCCGIREIAGLSYLGATKEDGSHWTMEDMFFDACRRAAPHLPRLPRCRYFIFSQAGDDANTTYGRVFEKFLLDNKLGEVVDSIPAGVNPNSSRHLKIWIWIPDRPAVEAWLEAEVKRRDYKFDAPVPKSDSATLSAPAQPRAGAGLLQNLEQQRQVFARALGRR